MTARFDAAALLEAYGDQALVRDLAQLLVENAPTQLDAIDTALAAGDATALRAAAHRLRGSLATFSVPAAVAMARQLEAMGAAGDLGPQTAALCNRLAADVRSLRESAVTWLHSSANR
jgi:two-component system, sensor histidine kinase and response regulator